MLEEARKGVLVSIDLGFYEYLDFQKVLFNLILKYTGGIAVKSCIFHLIKSNICYYEAFGFSLREKNVHIQLQVTFKRCSSIFK